MHFVDVGADTAVPARLSQGNEVMISLIDLFESRFEICNFIVGEVMCVLQLMSQTVFFFNRRVEDGFTCCVPAGAL